MALPILLITALSIFLFAIPPFGACQHVVDKTNEILHMEQMLQRFHQEYPRLIGKLATRHEQFKRAGFRENGPNGEDFMAELTILIHTLGNSLDSLIQLLQDYGIEPTSSSSATIFDTQSASSLSVLPITLAPTLSNGPYGTVTEISPTYTNPADEPISQTGHASNPSSTYVFNAQATNINVVYFGQTILTSAVNLSTVCASDTIDVVILGFVTDFFSPSGLPSMNSGPNCWAASAAQVAAGASGLNDCVSDGFADEVRQCQGRGKKVLLSLGGAISDTSIPSDEHARELANNLWNLFLGGTDDAELNAIRPFGPDVVLDGIDIDNEVPANALHIPTLAVTLRTFFASAPKPYYLTAAPQCPRPDLSIPVPRLLPYIDFFSVQFYNNPSCQLSSGAGFLSSLAAWSADILLVEPLPRPHRRQRRRRSVARFMETGNGLTAPRLLIGTPAWPGAGGGFVGVSTFAALLGEVRKLGLPNVAGAMYWDGSYQEVSGDVVDGVVKTFAEVVREVLG